MEVMNAVPPLKLLAEYQLNLDRGRVQPLGDALRLWFTEGARLLFGPLLEDLKTAPPLEVVGNRAEPYKPGQVSGQVKLDRRVDGRVRRSLKAYSDRNVEAFLSKLDDTLDYADIYLTHEADSRDACRLVASVGFSDPNLILLSCYMPTTWLKDATYEEALLEFARITGRPTNPLYGQIGYLRGELRTAFETRLGLAPPESIAETEAELRGYDWVTIVPQSLGERLGGTKYFEASGAFTEVTHLDRGGYFLLATPHFADYDMTAAEKVFEAVAPLLREGTPREANPLRAPSFIVMRDAADYRQPH